MHGVTAGDVNLTVTATDAIGLVATGDIFVTVRASAVASRAPMISGATLDHVEDLWSGESIPVRLEELQSQRAPFPVRAWIPVNPSFAAPHFGTDSAEDATGGRIVDLFAAVEGSASYSWAGYVGLPGMTLASRIQVGDRFTVAGTGGVFRVVGIPRYLRAGDSNPVLNHGYPTGVHQAVELAENPSLTTGGSWVWSAEDDVISWLPRTDSSIVHEVAMVTSTGFPAEYDSIADYLDAQLVRFPYASVRRSAGSISAGQRVEVLGEVWRVDHSVERFYRDRLLYIEAKMSYVGGPFQAAAPVIQPGNGGNGNGNGGNGNGNGGNGGVPTYDAASWAALSGWKLAARLDNGNWGALVHDASGGLPSWVTADSEIHPQSSSAHVSPAVNALIGAWIRVGSLVRQISGGTYRPRFAPTGADRITVNWDSNDPYTGLSIATGTAVTFFENDPTPAAIFLGGRNHTGRRAGRDCRCGLLLRLHDESGGHSLPGRCHRLHGDRAPERLEHVHSRAHHRHAGRQCGHVQCHRHGHVGRGHGQGCIRPCSQRCRSAGSHRLGGRKPSSRDPWRDHRTRSTASAI